MTSPVPPLVDFYFDFMSPYAYLAHHRLREIVAKHDAVIAFHPVDLQTVKLAAGNTGPSNRSIPSKIKHLTVDLRRWADKYNIPLQTVTNHASQRMGRGYFLAAAKSVGSEYVAAGYALGWGLGADLDSDTVLSDLAERMGWDGPAFLEQLESPALRHQHELETQQAVERGVFGVPTMIADDGTMWWGNDRLDWLEAYLIDRGNSPRLVSNIEKDA